MANSKSFKRKLKKTHFGMRYYRIFGTEITAEVAGYLKERGGVIIQHRGYYVSLKMQVSYVGMLERDNKFLKQRDQTCHKKWKHVKFLSGTISSYYRKQHQAQRDLDMYAAGIKTDGLDTLIRRNTSDSFAECYE